MGALHLFPICCISFASASKRLTLMPDLCRCFSSTCWQVWSLACLCLWLWITLWPFATLYAILPSSPTPQLARLALSSWLEVYWWWYHSLSWSSIFPVAGQTLFNTPLWPGLWPNYPVAISRLMPSMFSKLPYWMEGLISSVFPCLTPWLSML